MVAQDVMDERVAICLKCEHLLLRFICGKCGCPIKRKARKVPVGFCPAGLWVR